LNRLFALELVGAYQRLFYSWLMQGAGQLIYLLRADLIYKKLAFSKWDVKAFFAEKLRSCQQDWPREERSQQWIA
jgi:hypothetical protein